MTDAMNAKMSHATFELERSATSTFVHLFGDWRHHGVDEICMVFPDLPNSFGETEVILDAKNISEFDTAGAWLIRKFEKTCADKFLKLDFVNVSAGMQSLLAEIPTCDELENEPKEDHSLGLVHGFLRRTGIGAESLLGDIKMGLNILGAMIYGPQLKAGRKQNSSIAPIIHQMDQIGVRAVPIVILMSLAIGAIVSQQTAFQLRAFGADVFAADLVSVLQLREMGVLITSIMIAGRSGSAITAEIGSMKMREEVDALTVMGLNPIGVLVFPRMIALILTLPLLTIVANFTALTAAAVVLYFYSDVPPNVFLERMKAFIDYTTITSGMIKTPFMAIIIGVVAAVEGLKVEGSAESLGKRVTASVVKAIFLVIVIDGIFAIFYAAIDF
jgi:phospholipid/cholesterol/gamma-HCH transport system permease protein